jgi:predicted TIM-barrel enzyme
MMLLHHVHLKDAMELDQLISHLINKEESEGVVLVGHSTGCQVSSGCNINWSEPLALFKD